MPNLPFFILMLLCLKQTPPNNSIQKTVSGSTIYSHVAVYSLHYQSDSTNPASKEALMALLFNNNSSVFGAYVFQYAPMQIIFIFFVRKYGTSYHCNLVISYNRSFIFKYAVTDGPIRSRLELSKTVSFLPSFFIPILSGIDIKIAIARRFLTLIAGNSSSVSDGPYKFCGLPGLIVKVSDSQNYWNFTLTSFENQPYEYYEEIIRNKDAVSTDKNKFLELLKSSYDNGFEMEQQYGITFLHDIEGEKQRYRERAIKENNWIEKRSSKN